MPLSPTERERARAEAERRSQLAQDRQSMREAARFLPSPVSPGIAESAAGGAGGWKGRDPLAVMPYSPPPLPPTSSGREKLLWPADGVYSPDPAPAHNANLSALLTPASSPTSPASKSSKSGGEGPYVQSLRDRAQRELEGEDWYKYHALMLLNSLKKMRAKAQKEEGEGSFAEAWVTYSKVELMFDVVLSHKEYEQARGSAEGEKHALILAIKDYDFTQTIRLPSLKLLSRLQAVEGKRTSLPPLLPPEIPPPGIAPEEPERCEHCGYRFSCWRCVWEQRAERWAAGGSAGGGGPTPEGAEPWSGTRGMGQATVVRKPRAEGRHVHWRDRDWEHEPRTTAKGWGTSEQEVHAQYLAAVERGSNRSSFQPELEREELTAGWGMPSPEVDDERRLEGAPEGFVFLPGPPILGAGPLTPPLTPTSPTPTSHRSSRQVGQFTPPPLRVLNQLCEVCSVPIFKPELLPTERCTHWQRVCGECMQSYLAHSWERTEVRCPVVGCSDVLGLEEVKRWAEEEVFVRHDEFLLRRHLAEQPGFSWCKNPSCPSGTFHDSLPLPLSPAFPGAPTRGELEDADCTLLTCPDCGGRSCRKHDVPWHEGLTCEEYDRKRSGWWTREGWERRRVGWWKKRRTRQCPGCGTDIERSEGCDHITCYPPGGCGYHFCWRCGADYNLVFQLGNHLHRRWCKHWRPERGRGLRVRLRWWRRGREMDEVVGVW